MSRKLAAIAAVGGSLLSLSANASSGLNVQTLSPAFGTSYLMAESATPEYSLDGRTQAYRRYFLNVSYNLLNDPLVQLDPSLTVRQSTIVSRVQTLDLVTGVEFNGKVSLGVSLPLNLIAEPGKAQAFTPGDSRVFAKIFLVRERNKVNWALIPEIRLPTGSSDLYLSEGSVGAGMMLAAEYDFGVVKAAANAGYRYAGGATFQNMNFKSRIPMALGVTVPLNATWNLNGEISGAIPLPIDRFTNPSEAYLGVRYAVNRSFALHSGVGLGAIGGVGSGDYRVSIGLKFSPANEELKPEIPTKVVQVEPAPAPRVIWTRKEIKITEEVQFEHNKDVLTASGKNLLDEVAAVIKVNKGNFRKIRVEGHANELGTDKYNLDLSRRRAVAVREYLVSRGVAKSVLLSEGYGKRRPKSVGKLLSKQARLEINRRVEFKVIGGSVPVKTVIAPSKPTSAAPIGAKGSGVRSSS